MNFTKKQHYISRYIIKRFINQNGKIDAILLQSPPKRITQSVENVFSEKDFYEDKDREGNYINRNDTENKFSRMEREISIWLENFICILDDENRTTIFKRMIETGEYEKYTLWLMFHLTLVLIRLPAVKKIAFKESLPYEMQQLLYKNLLWGDTDAKELAPQLLGAIYSEQVEKVFNDKNNHGVIISLIDHLVNNHYMEIYEAPSNKKLYLSDNPVIVNDITKIDYFLPISPKYAIGLIRLTDKEMYKLNYPPLTMMTERIVDNINKKFISNASHLVVVQDMSEIDEQFILDTISS